MSSLGSFAPLVLCLGASRHEGVLLDGLRRGLWTELLMGLGFLFPSENPYFLFSGGFGTPRSEYAS